MIVFFCNFPRPLPYLSCLEPRVITQHIIQTGAEFSILAVLWAVRHLDSPSWSKEYLLTTVCKLQAESKPPKEMLITSKISTVNVKHLSTFICSLQSDFKNALHCPHSPYYKLQLTCITGLNSPHGLQPADLIAAVSAANLDSVEDLGLFKRTIMKLISRFKI